MGRSQAGLARHARGTAPALSDTSRAVGSDRASLPDLVLARKRKARERNLRSRFGIGVADYDAVLAHQDGKCAICRAPATKSLHVDHSHKTGIVRGLLCWRCNYGLSWYRDDPSLLSRASYYVARPPAVDVLGERIAPRKRASRRRLAITRETIGRLPVDRAPRRA